MTKSLTILPRLLLLTAAAFGISSGLHAQQLGYPVSGLYIGAEGGFSLKGNESIKNLSSNLQPLSSGLSTPNLNVGSNIGGAALGTVGWGFGNGLRVEAEFDYRGNSFNNVSGVNRAGFGASTGGHKIPSIAGGPPRGRRP